MTDKVQQAGQDAQDAGLESDPELDSLLHAAGEAGGDVSGDDLDSMFSAAMGTVEEDEAKPAHWFRSRSTLVRRVMAIGAFVFICMMTAIAMPPTDWSSVQEPRVLLGMLALTVLFGAAVIVATRPLQLPELPRWKVVTLATLSVAATFVLAVTVAGEPMPGHEHGSVWAHASPCMYMGLLAGIPVYGIARLLDRGAFLAPLLAAAAAGLAGNVALQIHCPMADPWHNLAGHASVALLFVGGMLLLERVLARGEG